MSENMHDLFLEILNEIDHKPITFTKNILALLQEVLPADADPELQLKFISVWADAFILVLSRQLVCSHIVHDDGRAKDALNKYLDVIRESTIETIGYYLQYLETKFGREYKNPFKSPSVNQKTAEEIIRQIEEESINGKLNS